MDVLQSGDERGPLLPRLGPALVALLVLSLAVPAVGVLSVPRLRAAQAPPEVTATTSGGSVIGGRLRVWLLLEGPASAALAVTPALPGSVVRARAPEAFSPRGDAVVRLDVTPACPQALAGLATPALRLRVQGDEVVVPFSSEGLLQATVRARCAGQDRAQQAGGPRLRAAGSGGTATAPGVLRTVVDLGAPGPEVLVVTAVTAGPGLDARPLTPLPLRVPPGRRAQLVVDLRAQQCALDPGAPPFVLELAADGDVEPQVDRALRGRLDALRRSPC